LVKHASRIIVALLEMMLASLYMLVLIDIGVLMLTVDLLNLLFTSFHIFAHGYLLVISLWSLVRIHSCFAILGIMVEYSSLNIYFYTL
jgi:hypothetical protein